MTAIQPSQDLQHDFELERRLAAKLRSATPAERQGLYAAVYDEFARESRGAMDGKLDPRDIARQVRIVTHFLPAGQRYLEIGAGACGVAAQIALSAASAQAVEVSAAAVTSADGVEVILTDGAAIPVPSGSIDLAFSNQVLEHLHPDDAAEHAAEVRRCLGPGGVYLCITPNRLTGPHDVSRHFSTAPEGLHLREYAIRDQRDLLLGVGFRDVRVAVVLGGEVLAVGPGRAYILLESPLARLPASTRRKRLVAKVLNPGAVVAYA